MKQGLMCLAQVPNIVTLLRLEPATSQSLVKASTTEPLRSLDGKPLIWYFANSEDTDEMPHDATFHHSLHCLLRQNQSSKKETQFFLNCNL